MPSPAADLILLVTLAPTSLILLIIPVLSSLILSVTLAYTSLLFESLMTSSFHFPMMMLRTPLTPKYWSSLLTALPNNELNESLIGSM